MKVIVAFTTQKIINGCYYFVCSYLFFTVISPLSHHDKNLQQVACGYIMASFKNISELVFLEALGNLKYFLLQINPCLPKQRKGPAVRTPQKVLFFSHNPPLCSPGPSSPITCLNTHAMRIFTVQLWFMTLTSRIDFHYILHYKLFHFALNTLLLFSSPVLLHFAEIGIRHWPVYCVSLDSSQSSIFSYFLSITERADRIARELDASAKPGEGVLFVWLASLGYPPLPPSSSRSHYSLFLSGALRRLWHEAR